MSTTKAKFKGIPEKGLFVGYILQRIRKNKNFLAGITGPTGSGKTYTALKLAESIDPNFNKHNIVFTPNEFIKRINTGKLKSGAVIVFDEAGVTLNSRKWQSSSNNLIQFILQTFRHQNIIVLFTAPDFSFIDTASRKLFHCYMETKGINFEKKLCYLKPFMIQVNQRNGNMYFKYLIAKIDKIGERKINKLNVGLATPEIIEAYEIKKKAFTDKLNSSVQHKLGEEEENTQEEKLPELTEKQKQIKEYLESGIKINELPSKVGISLQGLYKHKKAILKKGYEIIVNDKQELDDN